MNNWKESKNDLLSLSILASYDLWEHAQSCPSYFKPPTSCFLQFNVLLFFQSTKNPVLIV